MLGPAYDSVMHISTGDIQPKKQRFTINVLPGCGGFTEILSGLSAWLAIFGRLKIFNMKKILFSCLAFVAFSANAQEADEIKPAAKGVVYGTAPTAGEAVPVNDLVTKLSNGTFEGKITGKVKEVCQSMGCWMKLEKSDGSTVMVKTKDHGFFMPKNLAGRTVVIEGVASVNEETEAKQKHYAEDAGKSKKEIAKIKGAKKELQFTASGVKVLD
jgi:hypothetical protein